MRAWLAIVLSACAADPAPAPAACRDALAPGDLVVTEVMANPVGADPGHEWFEIYNASERALDLAGLAITHSRPDGSTAKVHRITELALAPARYAALGDVEVDQLPPYLDYGYGADLGELYDSGGGKLVLGCGTTAIAAASYDDVVEGHSRELGIGLLDAQASADPASWCECERAQLPTGDFGTPGAASDCVPLAAGQCADGDHARAIRAPAPGALAISEVMPDPAVEPYEDWFEIENVGGDAFDLNGLGLDRVADARPPDVIAQAACAPVAPGAFALFARSADGATNGMLPAVDATFGFSLVIDDGDVRVVEGDTVLASATWPTASRGVSLQLVPTACPGAAPYGDRANLGTPRAPNRCQ
ncbi:MAG TPA: lamin tail domain-containing protein [Kofleriaceae bacterium]|nr:lamin tail domain-containing protein [Kofleriaceae bacterium]